MLGLAASVGLIKLTGASYIATEGMGAEKIAAFYDDEVKVACDEFSHSKAFYLRSLSTETGFAWQARRFVKFVGQSGVGALRQARERVSLGPPDRDEKPAGRRA